MIKQEKCAICGREIKSNAKQLSCKELDYGHGNNCECYFSVGSDCYAKKKKELRRKIK